MSKISKLAALALAMLAVTDSAKADHEGKAYQTRTVAGWNVAVNNNSVCTMTSDFAYKPGIKSALVMAVSDNRKIIQFAPMRSDWNLPDGAQYEVKIGVDQRWQGRGLAKVTAGNMFTVLVPISEDLVLAVIKGGKLRIETDRTILTYGLNGTELALPELLRCAVAVEQSANPFAGASSKPATPF